MRALSQPHKAVSNKLLEKYQPLVHIFVLSPDGEIVSQKRMNEDIMDIYDEAWRANSEVEMFFLEYLETSRKEATRDESQPPES